MTFTISELMHMCNCKMKACLMNFQFKTGLSILSLNFSNVIITLHVVYNHIL